MRGRWVAALIALPLAGCFDVDQTLRVESDGNTVYQYKITLPAPEPGALPIQQLLSDKYCNHETIRLRSFAGSVESTSFQSEGKLVCRISISGDLVTVSAFIEDSFALSDVLDSGGASGTLFKLERLGTGSYRFKSQVPKLGADELAAIGGGPSREMLAKMTEGHAFRWMLTAPKITRTNGQLSADATTAKWEVPLIELFAVSPKPNEFVAEFETRVGWYDWLKSAFQ